MLICLKLEFAGYMGFAFFSSSAKMNLSLLPWIATCSAVPTFVQWLMSTLSELMSKFNTRGSEKRTEIWVKLRSKWFFLTQRIKGVSPSLASVLKEQPLRYKFTLNSKGPYFESICLTTGILFWLMAWWIALQPEGSRVWLRRARSLSLRLLVVRKLSKDSSFFTLWV